MSAGSASSAGFSPGFHFSGVSSHSHLLAQQSSAFDYNFDAMPTQRPRLTTSDSVLTVEALDASLIALCEFLYHGRLELESLFRWLDHQGTGAITHAAFMDGIRALAHVRRDGGSSGSQRHPSFSVLASPTSPTSPTPQLDLSERDLQRLARHLDGNRDGWIEYADFVRGFQPVNFHVRQLHLLRQQSQDRHRPARTRRAKGLVFSSAHTHTYIAPSGSGSSSTGSGGSDGGSMGDAQPIASSHIRAPLTVFRFGVIPAAPAVAELTASASAAASTSASVAAAAMAADVQSSYMSP
jgi:hypothetical protein